MLKKCYNIHKIRAGGSLLWLENEIKFRRNDIIQTSKIKNCQIFVDCISQTIIKFFIPKI